VPPRQIIVLSKPIDWILPSFFPSCDNSRPIQPNKTGERRLCGFYDTVDIWIGIKGKNTMENPTPITTNMDLLGRPMEVTRSPSSPTSLSSSLSSNAYNITYDPSQGIQVPGPTDVICGRGKMTVAHPGNKRFRQLVRERKDAYQRARRRDAKTRITCELVHTLRTGPDGGR
jgi:hypothetical protein